MERTRHKEFNSSTETSEKCDYLKNNNIKTQNETSSIYNKITTTFFNKNALRETKKAIEDTATGINKHIRDLDSHSTEIKRDIEHKHEEMRHLSQYINDLDDSFKKSDIEEDKYKLVAKDSKTKSDGKNAEIHKLQKTEKELEKEKKVKDLHLKRFERDLN